MPKPLNLPPFPEKPADRVRYSMAHAAHVLHENGGKASVKVPFVVGGWSYNEVRYLWTAAMVFSIKLGFPQEAIQLNTICFDPKKELRGSVAKLFTGSPFTSESLYNSEFKQHITEEMYVIQPFDEAYPSKPEADKTAAKKAPLAQLLETSAPPVPAAARIPEPSAPPAELIHAAAAKSPASSVPATGAGAGKSAHGFYPRADSTYGFTEPAPGATDMERLAHYESELRRITAERDRRIAELRAEAQAQAAAARP